jgi:hypothetical protein
MLKIRSAYVWMAVALALFCYLYFYDVKRVSTADQNRNAGKIFDFTFGQISRVEIVSADETIVLQKQGELWKITKPIDAVADLDTTTKILQELAGARSMRVISYDKIPEPKQETIQMWNLNPANRRVLIQAAGKTHELLVGRTLPSETSAYARTANQPGVPVLLVSEDLKKTLEKSLKEIRTRRVFTFNMAQVNKISLQEFASGTEMLTRETVAAMGANAKWSLQKPLAARANNSKVYGWLRELIKMEALDFVSDDSANLAVYGLATPQARLTVSSGGDSPDEETVLFGGAVPGKPDRVYAKQASRSSVFTVSKEKKDQALGLLPEVRDRFLLDIEPKFVTSVIVEKGGRKLEARRDGVLWKGKAAEEITLDEKRVTQFIRQVSTTPILNFVRDSASDLKSFGLDRTATKIILSQTGTHPERIEVCVGRTEKGQSFVCTTLEPFVYGVPADFAAKWPKTVYEWRDPKIFDFKPADVTSLKLERQSGSLVIKRGANSVFTPEPPGVELDALKLDSVLRALSELKATRFLEAAPSANIIKAPELRVTVETNSKNQALSIGPARADGTRVAVLDGSPVFFEISAEDAAALTQDVLLR